MANVCPTAAALPKSVMTSQMAPDSSRLYRVLSRLQRYHPKTIDLSLDRIFHLLEALGHPERQCPPVFHVAGTNGKGSVVAYLRAINESAGLKVHAYTSPHLVRFEERVRLAGKLIETKPLIQLLEICERANQERPITFFEITTAAAFLAFASTKADVCILEVGLGGRLDATNVIASPAVSIITPVGFDHAAYLGRTISKIAFEKAGVAKKNTPLVVGPQPPAAQAAIMQQARQAGANLFLAGRDWQTQKTAQGFVFRGFGKTLCLPTPSLAGEHQIDNAALAVAAVFCQNHVRPKEKDLHQGLLSASWPARLQTLPPARFRAGLAQGSRVWLDGGHNPMAGRALGRFLRALTVPSRRRCVVVGMKEGKDARGFLAPLLRHAHFFYAVPMTGQEHHISPRMLVRTARDLGCRNAHVSKSAFAALHDLSQKNKNPVDVLITGSLYLSGEILSRLRIYPE